MARTPTPALLVELEGRSDKGRRRPTNEDAIFYARSVRGDIVVGIADGMGGVLGGDIASVQALGEAGTILRGTSDSLPSELLAQAIEVANRAVHERASRDESLHGMGTTLVLGVVRGTDCWVANVGDSRAYLVSSSEARRLTADHTLAAEQAKALGFDAQKWGTRTRNILTRTVGVEPVVVPDVSGPYRIQRGELLLLCSDGLHNVVSEKELRTLATVPELASGLDDLIDLANERGGTDNISLVAARIPAASTFRQDGTMPLLGYGAVLSLLIATVLVWLVIR